MLIDLERNDIGKVCEIGSVEVDELMVIETYEHVHHIVSNVKGRIKSDVTILDAIKALFPGGTITGCPKIRCMEIIHQIENGLFIGRRFGRKFFGDPGGNFKTSPAFGNCQFDRPFLAFFKFLENLKRGDRRLKLIFAGLKFTRISECGLLITPAEASLPMI